jgi:hypothetical protein
LATWAFALKESAAKREGYDRSEIRGTIQLDLSYAGCPHCAKSAVVRCGSCGKVSCWNGETRLERKLSLSVAFQKTIFSLHKLLPSQWKKATPKLRRLDPISPRSWPDASLVTCPGTETRCGSRARLQNSQVEARLCWNVRGIHPHSRRSHSVIQGLCS